MCLLGKTGRSGRRVIMATWCNTHSCLVLSLVPFRRVLPEPVVVGHEYFLTLGDGSHCNCNRD
jgi:hypothetical protein